MSFADIVQGDGNYGVDLSVLAGTLIAVKPFESKHRSPWLRTGLDFLPVAAQPFTNLHASMTEAGICIVFCHFKRRE